MIQTAIVMALLHLTIATIHGAAHFGLGVFQPPLETVFIALVLYLAPAVAAILLRKKSVAFGAGLLFASLLLSLLFGTYRHFLAPSLDHVAHLPPGSWRAPFKVTAFLAVPIDAVGAAVGLWTLIRGSSVPSERSAQL